MPDKTIYDLKLHEYIHTEGNNIYVTRVPGGWIYETINSEINMGENNNIYRPVFVPFNNEFQKR